MWVNSSTTKTGWKAMKLQALNVSLYKMGHSLMLRPRKEKMNETIFFFLIITCRKLNIFRHFYQSWTLALERHTPQGRCLINTVTALQSMKEEMGEEDCANLTPSSTEENVTLTPPQQWAFHMAVSRMAGGWKEKLLLLRESKSVTHQPSAFLLLSLTTVHLLPC